MTTIILGQRRLLRPGLWQQQGKRYMRKRYMRKFEDRIGTVHIRYGGGVPGLRVPLLGPGEGDRSMGERGRWALALHRRKEDGAGALGAWALGGLGVGNEGRAQGQAIKDRVPTPTPTPTHPILFICRFYTITAYRAGHRAHVPGISGLLLAIGQW
jgi:hypothetical protein